MRVGGQTGNLEKTERKSWGYQSKQSGPGSRKKYENMVPFNIESYNLWHFLIIYSLSNLLIII